MPHRSEKYARQAIAASGLTILDPRIAFELRPDLWASAQDCRITFRRAQKFEGTHRVTATIEDYGDVLVCTRSLDALEQRIQWIAGRRVLAVKPAEADAVPPPATPQLHRQAQSKEVERLAELEKLAAQEPPSHDCHARREILAARAELKRIPA
jgi:hypothetical protein